MFFPYESNDYERDPPKYIQHPYALFDPDTGERVRCKRCWTKGNYDIERSQHKVVSDTEGYQCDYFDCRYCGRQTYAVTHMTFEKLDTLPDRI